MLLFDFDVFVLPMVEISDSLAFSAIGGGWPDVDGSELFCSSGNSILFGVVTRRFKDTKTG